MVDPVSLATPLDEAKWGFIQGQMIALSIQGAFQRANVYDPETSDGPMREELRKRLALLLRDLGSQYAKPVSEAQHKINIKKIADDLKERFKGRDLLRDGVFRIGIAQKALNLYLKYLWCLNKASPPHCPFDSGIIAKLDLTVEQKKRLQFTKFDSLDDYQALVDAGLRRIKPKYSSLSEWELHEWNSLSGADSW